MLMTKEGERLVEPQAIADEAVNFYIKLLGTTDPLVVGGQVQRLQQLLHYRVSEEHKDFPVKPVTEEEVKRILWSMGDNKAPGPDGFSAHFLKSKSHLVGIDFTLAMQSFFTKSKLMAGVNSPKSAFEQGRDIGDNIQLARKLVQDYQRRGVSSRCAIKADIMKAFDDPIGLKLNPNKTELYAAGLEKAEVKKMTELSGFRIGKLPVRRSIWSTGYTSEAKVAEVVSGSRWQWKNGRHAIISVIRDHLPQVPDANTRDEIVWTAHSKGNYTTPRAWNHLRVKGSIRVGTICFLNAPFSSLVKNRGIHRRCNGWDFELEWAASRNKGKSLQFMIARLVWHAHIYHVWRARNERIFADKPPSAEKTLARIKYSVRRRIMGVKRLDRKITLVQHRRLLEGRGMPQ
ncbi:hypothetical protein CRG98_000167 [Punica granatum]|uniref:Reverse transcriptase domain-containing protein n=1 Tax=Punica granatum TaxID=22663 RepID=A0A2I0LFI4_PUNGR|nr:hypothetical protein CRG98_000167 [Punica granatum]